MSSNNFPVLQRAVTAGAAVNARRILKYGAADNAVLQSAAAADLHVAVSIRAMAVGIVDDAIFLGIAPVEYGGVVTRGQALTSDAVGRAVVAAAGNRIIGVAAESGILGTFGSVQLGPAYVP